MLFLGSAASGMTNYYVATNGNNGAAGTSWATALQTVSNAVARTLDGDVILLSNGTHNIAGEIKVTKGITLQGAWGRAQTIVRRSGAASYRLFTVSNANAVLTGVDLRNGYANNTHGGAVWMYAGTIRDCNLANNTASANGVGGGVYALGGAVRDCNLTNNYGASSGGGLYLAGSCLVSNCFIAKNRAEHGGAGLTMTSAGAVVTRCVIRNNTNSYYTGGGGIYMSAGTVRNCLITGNRQTLDGSGYGGGGVRQAGGTVLNCTIADNRVLGGNKAGGLWWTAGNITNTIVSGNIRGTVADNLLAVAATTIRYSCAPELTNGTGNVSQDPDFIDLAGGNYRLSPGSPCIDGGTSVASVPLDIEGTARPQDGNGIGGAQWDMGVYEAQSPTGGALRCSFSGSPRAGLSPLPVVLQAAVAGSNTAGLVYYWDVNGDGTPDRVGAALGTITNAYPPGIHDVTLTVSNAAATAQRSKADYIMVQAQTMYVATGGGNTMPYTNWAMAATDLASALALAGNGTTITVSNGTYNCSEQNILSAIVLRSANGRAVTTLRHPTSSARVLVISHAQAVVEGFTLTGGLAPNASGGAVFMTAGTIRNCNLSKSTASANGTGGGAYVTGGTIRDCNITNNYGASSGGGLYLAGSCLVSNCFFANNKAEHGGAGLTVAAAGAVVERCVIRNNTNTYYTGGAGINISAGTVRNCLVTANRQVLDGSGYGGGGIRQSGGTIVNCTVAGNYVLGGNTAGGLWWTAGNITNAIVYGNFKGTIPDNLLASGATTIRYSCAPELTNGVGNVSQDPNFVDLPGANYRLAPGSPCIDSGRSMPGLAIDVEGTPRPQDGDGAGGAQWDMGAYEALSPTGGALRCSFSGTPRSGLSPLAVVYQASVAGSNTAGVTYYWDVNGDGTTDRAGAALGTITNTYAPGVFDVKLTVSNASARAENLKTGYITVQAQTMYVATGGGHLMPYTNWAMAATNLATVMTLAGNGTTITVSNGTYTCMDQVLQNAIVLRSANGRMVTTLRHPTSTARLLVITHAQVVVDGFTLTGGLAPNASGGAINMTAGTVRNCRMYGNTASANGVGGAVYMTGGTVRDCIITNNYGASSAGGIYLAGSCLVSNCFLAKNTAEHGGGGLTVASAGALVTHCVVSNNTDTYYTGGGGIYLSAGTVRNCLVLRNRVTLAGSDRGGGGVRQSGGALLNCTIVSNQVVNADNPGGGVWWTAGSMTNTIIYGNVRVATANNLFASALTTIGYSCAPELTAGVNGNITANPLFKSPAEQDYRLGPGSPCIDAGRNLSWMAGATDLDGGRRVAGAQPDMGAYESRMAGGALFLFR